MREYKKPLITIDVLDIEDIITTSGSTQFTQSGDVTGQTTDWDPSWY